MRSTKKWLRHAPHAAPRRRALLNVEVLESRLVPYVTSGGAWPSPQLVTISFVPDGTDLGGVSSNLFATFNAHPGWKTSTWENQILKAAQSWAQQTNLNFSVVSDNGTAIGGGNYQQGDPGMGDIRFGGYDFGAPTMVAQADLPPPLNNFSAAGDIQFNTAQPFNIGSTFDLYSVAMHEIGHVLGLLHTTSSPDIMQGFYQQLGGLGTDDTSGIRNLYSSNNPRTPDRYNTGSNSNGSFANATNINSYISNLTALVTGLDVTRASQVEYFTFTVPSGSSRLVVKAQSSGLSLLAPTLTVYNSSQQQIGSASGAGQYGTTLTVTITGVTAGTKYYVKVAGADSSAFGTGAYALTLNFGSGSSPTVPLPNTQLLDGNPIVAQGAQPVRVGGATLGFNDTFSLIDTDTLPPTQATSPPTSSPPPSGASQNPIVAIGFAVSRGGQAATILTSATAAIPALQSQQVAMTATVTTTQPSSGSSVESGGGANTVLTEDSSDGSPAQPDPSSPLFGQEAAISPDHARELGTDAASWRNACTACFATEQSAQIQDDGQDESGALPAVEESAILNPGAAVASLAILLGGYWRAQPTEPFPQRFRRSARRILA
jgi:hypothetical protein